MMNDNNVIRLMVKMTTYTGHETMNRVRKISKARQIPMSRLLAIAIDKELEQDHPFGYDLTLPETGDYPNYTFADESAKIKKYVDRLTTGLGLDYLTLLRKDIGIEDKETFLAAFKECLDNNVFSAVKPKKNDKKLQADDYLIYRSKKHKSKRQEKNQENDLETYLKLKKKFEEEL